MDINGTYRGLTPIGGGAYGEARLVINDDCIIYSVVTEDGPHTQSFPRAQMRVLASSEYAMKTLVSEVMYGIAVAEEGPCFIWVNPFRREEVTQVFTRWPEGCKGYPEEPWLYTPAQVEAGVYHRKLAELSKHCCYLMQLPDEPTPA